MSGDPYNGGFKYATPEESGQRLDAKAMTMPEYGGRYGLANAVAGQYYGQGANYANRQIGTEFSNPYRMQQGEARGMQQGALALNAAAAAGQAPSSAQIGQGAALSNAQASQFAASRGGGNPALAQAGAMHNGANAGMSAVNAGSQARAQEIAAAQRAYMGSAEEVRGADTKALSIDQQRELQQAEMNQKMRLASEGMGNDVLLGQLGADASGYAARYGGQLAAQTATNIYNSQQNMNALTGAMGAASGLAGAYANSAPPVDAEAQALAARNAENVMSDVRTKHHIVRAGGY